MRHRREGQEAGRSPRSVWWLCLAGTIATSHGMSTFGRMMRVIYDTREISEKIARGLPQRYARGLMVGASPHQTPRGSGTSGRLAIHRACLARDSVADDAGRSTSRQVERLVVLWRNRDGFILEAAMSSTTRRLCRILLAIVIGTLAALSIVASAGWEAERRSVTMPMGDLASAGRPWAPLPDVACHHAASGRMRQDNTAYLCPHGLDRRTAV
jgi:hypothetical protein